MEHMYSSPCPECERDIYVRFVSNNDPKSLNIPVEYHLGERCAITPSYDDVRHVF